MRLKKYIFLFSLLQISCTSSRIGSVNLLEASDDTQIMAQALVGPNPVSGNIITGLNYYRTANGMLTEPLYGYDVLKNLWRP